MEAGGERAETALRGRQGLETVAMEGLSPGVSSSCCRIRDFISWSKEEPAELRKELTVLIQWR